MDRRIKSDDDSSREAFHWGPGGVARASWSGSTRHPRRSARSGCPEADAHPGQACAGPAAWIVGSSPTMTAQEMPVKPPLGADGGVGAWRRCASWSGSTRPSTPFRTVRLSRSGRQTRSSLRRSGGVDRRIKSDDDSSRDAFQWGPGGVARASWSGLTRPSTPFRTVRVSGRPSRSRCPEARGQAYAGPAAWIVGSSPTMTAQEMPSIGGLAASRRRHGRARPGHPRRSARSGCPEAGAKPGQACAGPAAWIVGSSPTMTAQEMPSIGGLAAFGCLGLDPAIHAVPHGQAVPGRQTRSRLRRSGGVDRRIKSDDDSSTNAFLHRTAPITPAASRAPRHRPAARPPLPRNASPPSCPCRPSTPACPRTPPAWPGGPARGTTPGRTASGRRRP